MLYKDRCLSSFQVLINGLHHFVSMNVKPKLQMVETFIKVRMSMATHFPIYVSPMQMSFCHLVDLVACWCLTCFINLYLACGKLPLNAKKDLLLMETYLTSALKPGLLPSRDRICALGTCTPRKNIPSLWHYTLFAMCYWSISFLCRNTPKVRLLGW